MSAATLLCSKLYGRGQIYLNISIFTREYSAFLCKPCAFLLAVSRNAMCPILPCQTVRFGLPSGPYRVPERTVWQGGTHRLAAWKGPFRDSWRAASGACAKQAGPCTWKVQGPALFVPGTASCGPGMAVCRCRPPLPSCCGVAAAPASGHCFLTL